MPPFGLFWRLDRSWRGPSSRLVPPGHSALGSLVLRTLQNTLLSVALHLLFTGAYDWAQTTLKLHAKDKRPYLYSLQELEQGSTHDPLWNAAQVLPYISLTKR